MNLLGQLAEGDAPVTRLQSERQTVLDQRVIVETELAAARARPWKASTTNCASTSRSASSATSRPSPSARPSAQRKLDQQALSLKAEQLSSSGGRRRASCWKTSSTACPKSPTFDGWEQGRQPTSTARCAGWSRSTWPPSTNSAKQAQRQELPGRAERSTSRSALETLEEAIRKIDRETRGRFKDTFDRVNAGVQELYPRLFGGGHAYLELTGEDLLDTGVAIMARPPGKRVSNISLLSGGEKAMTAVALVFAIFQLNPAPFCLLDEVDAPLDEANVGRFTAMVTEMSEKVQFLFVTHNKATMEAATQLSPA